MSYNQQVQKGIEEYRRSDRDGELDSLEIASWLYYQQKLAPPSKTQIQLLQKDVSRAMSTQTTVDEKGRRVRQKLCLRTRVERPDGGSYIEATWFDKDIAPAPFKEKVFAQRRESVANILWQLKQDVDHFNDFDNPGEEWQLLLDFGGDMADRQFSINYPTSSEEDDLDEDDEDFADQRLAAAD